MNKVEEFHKALEEFILKADLEQYNLILQSRTEWIGSYQGKDKREVLLSIQQKDQELMKTIQERAAIVKAQIIKEDDINRNRGTFKLYE